MSGIEQLRNNITEIVNNTSMSVQMYFVLKDSITKEFSLRKASLESKKTEPEVESLFIDVIRRDIIDNLDLEERKLSEYDGIKGPLYKYDYEEYPDEMHVIKDFNISEAVEYDTFDFENDDINQLFGFLIYIGTMDEGFTLFKKHYSMLLLKRDTFLLMFKANNRIEKMPSEELLKINGEFQIIKYHDDIYIKDVNVMERNLGFNDLIQKDAIAAVEAIDNIGLIEDVEVLEDSLEDITFVRKLARAMKTSPVFQKEVSRERIIDFTKRTEKLKGMFDYSEDGKTIRLATKKSKLDFIKLLNDDFLKSELTEEYYDARSKDQM